jgi:uncharacterized protein
MNPLHFGSSERILFGLHHPALGKPGKNRGVILCNPFGDEAIKAHRAFRELAKSLATAGYDVLRFDYYGTGDSAGNGEDATLAQWIEDAGDAADELKDASGVAKVSFVGLRFGCTLAIEAAKGRRDLDRVVLWVPVVRGGAYLDELAKFHEALLRTELISRGRGEDPIPPTTGLELLGFPISTALRAEISATDLRENAFQSIRQVGLIASNQTPRILELAKHLESQNIKLNHSHIPVGVNWNSDEAINSSLVPKEAIMAIVDALSGKGPKKKEGNKA